MFNLTIIINIFKMCDGIYTETRLSVFTGNWTSQISSANIRGNVHECKYVESKILDKKYNLSTSLVLAFTAHSKSFDFSALPWTLLTIWKKNGLKITIYYNIKSKTNFIHNALALILLLCCHNVVRFINFLIYF